MLDPQPALDRLNAAVVERTGRVLLAFLLLTAVFAVGLGNVSTSSGTQQFTQDVPAATAFEDVQQEFGPPFGSDRASTTLIQRGQNVLAKPALLRMLTALERLRERESLRVVDTASAASIVARVLAPNATTLARQRRAIRRATPSEIDAAVRRAAERPGFTDLLSEDFNPREASASATIATVTHALPGAGGTGPGASGQSPLTSVQLESQRVVATVGGDVVVFGSGIVASEFGNVILDSLLLVVPAAVLFILAFLVLAYRDPIDLALGVASLVMALVWTFGFMGLVGIPFTQMLIAVPPLLLAVGIDFGIHAVNRYREERAAGADMDASLVATTDQLLVAFFLVTATTVIGFGANLTSSLGPIREFGIVASVGILFTFLVFGVFLPAAKLWLDRRRDRYGLPSFGTTPLGSEGSALGRVLPVGVVVARRAPVVALLVLALVAGGSGYYATGVDTSFQQEDFLPPEETPAYLRELPEPFRPHEYTVTGRINFLQEHFASGSRDTVVVYVEGPMTRDYALEALHRAGRNPPDTFLRADGHAVSRSIVDVIRAYAAVSPEFRRLVARNDRNGNGIPDDDLGAVYDALMASPYGDEARRFLAEDYRSARVVYSVESSASQSAVTADARAVADRHRYRATATGQIVVFQAVSDVIFRSALTSLALALLLTAAFLLAVYWLLLGRPSLGVANLVPILLTVALLAGTMRALSIPFNALTATILSITIGLGIDYSVHVVHRFADEFEGLPGGGTAPLYPALLRTVRGTGGALTGSMLTTVFGIGVLVVAITPILGQFGVLTGLSILYSYLSSLLVLPSALAVWARLAG